MDTSEIIDVSLSEIDITALTTDDLDEIVENETLAMEESKPLSAQLIDVKMEQPPKVPTTITTTVTPSKRPAPLLNAVPPACTYCE